MNAHEAEYGVTPNVVSYGAACDACAKAGDWQRALVLLNDLELAGGDGKVGCEDGSTRGVFLALLGAQHVYTLIHLTYSRISPNYQTRASNTTTNLRSSTVNLR